MPRRRRGLVFFDGAALRAVREDRRLTRAQLAVLIDAEPASVSRWESGAQKPDPRAVRALAQAFEVPVLALTLLEGYDDDRIGLAELRTLRGLTRPDAATALGITTTQLTAHETASRVPAPDLVSQLAALYEVTVSQVDAAVARTQHRKHAELDALRSQARHPRGTS